MLKGPVSPGDAPTPEVPCTRPVSTVLVTPPGMSLKCFQILAPMPHKVLASLLFQQDEPLCSQKQMQMCTVGPLCSEVSQTDYRVSFISVSLLYRMSHYIRMQLCIPTSVSNTGVLLFKCREVDRTAGKAPVSWHSQLDIYHKIFKFGMVFIVRMEYWGQVQGLRNFEDTHSYMHIDQGWDID